MQWVVVAGGYFLVDTPVIPTDNFVWNNDIQNSDVRNSDGTPDIRGYQNFKRKSPDPHLSDLILHLFVNTCCHQSPCQI